MKSWKFLNNEAIFSLDEPDRTSYLYFPLVNEAGMISVVTPTLHGDAKTSQHSYLLPPVSVEDLHTSRAARNFWVTIQGAAPWSVTGNSAAQIASQEDSTTVQAGFLWHKIIRQNNRLHLRAEITTIVPVSRHHVELIRITLCNTDSQPLSLAPTAAIPIYGRSADNLRDHRHVTSLLHRIRCQEYGVFVRPTLSFDERGHQPNSLLYAVLGTEQDGRAPIGFFPVLEDFIGEGGNLDWPAAVCDENIKPLPVGASIDGYEAMGGLRFSPLTLQPGEAHSYILILAILAPEDVPDALIEAYGSVGRFEACLEEVKSFWKKRLSSLEIFTSDPQFDRWIKWVTLQPTLRRLMGNSFLPYHDYGRGGRGWRDLWQDILALLLLDTGPVDHLLLGNFAGVRLDGSNATIIGNNPGEFKADRNNIPRVWMDHGAWPLLTTHLYIDQTGDLAFLLREQEYFHDGHTHRAQAFDVSWSTEQGTRLRTTDGEIYRGTIIEHLLLQHLTAFFNVGEHNHILLEGADWNDGMDMARQRGESVAFSAMYAGNLHVLAELVNALSRSGVNDIEIFGELLILLDTLQQKSNYDSVEVKRQLLETYFESVSRTISGRKVHISLDALARDLENKSRWMINHIRTREWIQTETGYGWFNGYYDNDGQRLEGEFPQGVRMTLTGQVFTLMSGIASAEQTEQLLEATHHYLWDRRVGGYRLNTDFQDVLLNVGRCFGFAYGHKENGAMFSHMAVMYAYALYERGYAGKAYETLERIYSQSVDFPVSRMYPGLPEYFSRRGRGVYPYLTGSASWYLLTLITRSFGVRGKLGNLILDPALTSAQFDDSGKVTIWLYFAGHPLSVTYHNPSRLEVGDYKVGIVRFNGQLMNSSSNNGCFEILRQAIDSLNQDELICISVELTPVTKV